MEYLLDTQGSVQSVEKKLSLSSAKTASFSRCGELGTAISGPRPRDINNSSVFRPVFCIGLTRIHPWNFRHLSDTAISACPVKTALDSLCRLVNFPHRTSLIVQQ